MSKDRLALVKMRTIDTVQVDKTGTLAAGEHVVTDIAPLNGDPDSLLAAAAAVLYVVVDGEIHGAIALEDAVRAESRAAIDGLHGRGISVVMITGDSQAVANHVATELGVDEVHAEVLPEDKDTTVAELQDRAVAPTTRPSTRGDHDRRTGLTKAKNPTGPGDPRQRHASCRPSRAGPTA